MKGLLLFVFCLVGVSELRADQTVTVRSGNGSIGSQDSLIHVLPFNTTGDITPTPANFTAAQTAPFAYIDAPYATYIPSLPADLAAKWIAVGPNLPQGSALFAVSFQVSDSTIISATLDLHFAVDNAVNGVFFNGQRISGNSFDGDYHAQYEFVRNDIGPLLVPNATNWLYVNMSDYGALAGIIFSATITTTGGNSATVVPKAGGNTGYVSVDITGQAFADAPATVTLRTSGQPDIIGIAPQVISATEVVDTFNLLGAAPGPRDIIVSQNGVDIATYPDGFTIESGGAPELEMDIIGPSRIRGGRPGTFYVDVSNIGSIDAPFVSVEAQATAVQPTSSALSGGMPSAPSKANATALAGLPGCSVGPQIIYVGRGIHQQLPLSCTPQGSACYDLSGDATEDQRPDCTAAQKEVNDAQQMVNDLKQEIASNEFLLRDARRRFQNACVPPPTDPTALSQCVALQGYINGLIGKIAQLEALLRVAELRLARARAALEICLAGGSTSSGLVLRKAVPSSATTIPPGSASSSLQFCGVTALDPNAKIGVSGVGQAQYVRGSIPLDYTIQFENLPTARASASQVVVTDALDSSLDPSTLSLRSIEFGSTDIELPPGLSSYTTTVDLTSTLGLLVNVSASLTANNLTLTLTSIDPLTGQPPTDLRGFLPPDTNPPNGEGSVTFTILPKARLSTDTQIPNGATVVFDTNAPINTNVWQNTVDNSAPTSSVVSLPSTENSYSFPVQWSGTDEGSGIKDFTIYVSDNGGPYVPWLLSTTTTQGLYVGVGGHVYSFYSQARDFAGNVEALKTTAEATTTVLIDTTAPVIIPSISGTQGLNGWYTSAVTVSWSVTDPESGIASSNGCAANTLSTDTGGLTLTCSATNGAGLSSAASVTIRIDQTPPVISGMPPAGCTLWPPNHKLVPVATVTASDALSGVTSFSVVETSNEPSDPNDPDSVITGTGLQPRVVQLRADRFGNGTGRTYTLTTTATDVAGNSTTSVATCTVPHDQGH